MMCKVFGFQIKSGELNPQVIIEQLQELMKQQKIVIQLFNARYIYGQDHIISSYAHAKRAFAENRAHSSNLAMEVLLYTSGKNQINIALEKLGLKKDSTQAAIVLIGDLKNEDNLLQDIIKILSSAGAEVARDDDVLNGDKSTLEEFGLTKEELTAVPEDQWFDLVLEKVALVDIKK